MAFTKRCFSSVPALKRLSPQVLRDLMVLFPDFVAANRLGLPRLTTGDTLDYESIRDALMAEDVPGDMDDILYLSSLLGDSKGWEIIRDQARDEGVVLPYPSAKLSHLDLAILALRWIGRRTGICWVGLTRARAFIPVPRMCIMRLRKIPGPITGHRIRRPWRKRVRRLPRISSSRD